MTTMASQITSRAVVYLIACSESKKTSQLRVTGVCAGNSPVMRKVFPFDDVIMVICDALSALHRKQVVVTMPTLWHQKCNYDCGATCNQLVLWQLQVFSVVARASAGTVTKKFWSRIYTGLALDVIFCSHGWMCDAVFRTTQSIITQQGWRWLSQFSVVFPFRHWHNKR